MLLELRSGPSFAAQPGVFGALSVGAGGKLAGSPLRLYALGTLAAGHRETHALVASQQRNDLFFGGGLRTYLGLLRGLRAHLDLTAGGRLGWDRLALDFGRPLSRETFDPELRVGVGVQYRFVRAWSLGLGLVHRIFADPIRSVSQAQGLPETARWSGHGSITWHF